MNRKKIFILLPDGVGLKNFAFTNFYDFGIQNGFDLVFWNITPFDLAKLGYQEIKIENAKSHPLSNFYKIAQSQIELNQNIKKSNDTIYNAYRFPYSIKTFKIFLKKYVVETLIFFNNSERGLERIRKKIAIYESKTLYFHMCLEVLEKEKPDLVFCTNQRVMLAIAPLLAAKQIGIPTATFIFSWDNLPKATKVIESDYYFVWSELMKKQLLKYYPYIKEPQIQITGTPQFETHYEKKILLSKEVFFKNYNLDQNKEYICFSGDDITTSPNDPTYLNDLANAIQKLNETGLQLGIIFRRCPVDFSDRYDETLKKHADIIKIINPQWEKIADSWSAILPTKEDLILQMNTIYHSVGVVNLGSSMVFDFAAFDKPCAYINYEVENLNFPNWSVGKIYKFIHFQSMPNSEAVFWMNDQQEIDRIILEMLGLKSKNIVENAKKWFKIINQHPPQLATQRIFSAIEEVIKK
jgi:hypothetical protein